MIDPLYLKPGDVLVMGTPDPTGWLLRLWARLVRRDARVNHVAMFTHIDAEGIPRGLEGRPSGFGWANLTRYLNAPTCLTNAGYATWSDASRARAVEYARQMIDIPYDWRQITAFALQLTGREFRTEEWPETGLPSHVQCASGIDLIYEAVGWDNPGGWVKTRGTSPQDWADWLQRVYP